MGTALNKKNNVTLIAKKEEEVRWYNFTFGFSCRLSFHQVFIKGRKNCKDYVPQLEIELLSYESDYGGEIWMYQQDGYFIHTA